MSENGYNRASQDMGNILAMEHVNVTITSQEKAHLFYGSALGLTRDPFMMAGPENMWMNVGQQQFHLPTREKSQVIPGHIGLVVPNLEELKARLMAAQPRLDGTAFGCSAENGYVEVTCPWGNHFRCHAPGAEFGDMVLGIPYVEFLVKPGTASGIGQFYKEVLQAPYTLTQDMSGGVARVKVGRDQYLIFRETNEEIPEYDGHHIAVYVANFSAPHAWLKRRNAITQESSEYQYRFQDILHPETGRHLFTIEHEVRSFTHPMYGREIVNRNASQNIGGYARGRDVFVPAGR
jgi:hypothetical protein